MASMAQDLKDNMNGQALQMKYEMKDVKQAVRRVRSPGQRLMSGNRPKSSGKASSFNLRGSIKSANKTTRP